MNIGQNKKLEIVARQNVGFTQEDLDALNRLEAKLAQEYGIRRMGTARAIRFALRAALDDAADPKDVAESIKNADGRIKQKIMRLNEPDKFDKVEKLEEVVSRLERKTGKATVNDVRRSMNQSKAEVEQLVAENPDRLRIIEVRAANRGRPAQRIELVYSEDVKEPDKFDKVEKIEKTIMTLMGQRKTHTVNDVRRWLHWSKEEVEAVVKANPDRLWIVEARAANGKTARQIQFVCPEDVKEPTIKSDNEVFFYARGEPTATPRPRAAQSKNGTSYVYNQNGPALAYRHSIERAARQELESSGKQNGAVKVDIVFHFMRPLSHYNFDKHGRKTSLTKIHRENPHHTCKPDLDNLEKTVLDALTDSGLIDDDAAVVRLSSEKHWKEKESGTFIKIEKI
tara:strand:+ start:10152 stop:11342 length:1191 start_codon:yes stop_codon:yes gene_type:complete